MELNNEIDRIKNVYKLRDNNVNSLLYSFFNSGNLFIIQNREREFLNVFKKFNPIKLHFSGCF